MAHMLLGMGPGVTISVVECVSTHQFGRTVVLLKDKHGNVYHGTGSCRYVVRCNEATKRAYAKLRGMTYKALREELLAEQAEQIREERETEVNSLNRTANRLGFKLVELDPM